MGLLNHVGLTVADLERSIEFYTLLGFQAPPPEWVFVIEGEWLSKMVQEEGATARVAFLPMDDGTVLELLQYTQPEGEKENHRPNRDAGAMHVALNVQDLDGLYERLKDRIQFNCEPQTVPTGPWAGARVVYLTDPDGTPVELVQS